MLSLLGISSGSSIIRGQRAAGLHQTLARGYVQVYHAEYAADDEAYRSDGQAEVAAAGEAVVGLKVAAPAQRAAGALAEAHGQNESRGVERAVEEEEGYRDDQADKRLDEIAAGHDGAGLDHLDGGDLLLLLRGLERHRGKAQAEAVVGDDLHGGVVHQRRERRYLLEYEHQESAYYRGGYVELFQERHLCAQDIADQYGDKQNSQLTQKCPDIGVGEYYGFRHKPTPPRAAGKPARTLFPPI